MRRISASSFCSSVKSSLRHAIGSRVGASRLPSLLVMRRSLSSSLHGGGVARSATEGGGAGGARGGGGLGAAPLRLRSRSLAQHLPRKRGRKASDANY